jgi:hypothetical protein
MALTLSDKAAVGRPALTTDEIDTIIPIEATAVMAAAAAGDIVKGFILPANHVPHDMMLIADDLDTNGTPTITLTVAVLNAGFTDITASTEFIIASTVAQAGGVVRADKKVGLCLAPSTSDRWIGVKIVAASATFQAGSITLVGSYRQGNFD